MNQIPSLLVIGGGIAGIQASLDVADFGFKVYLIEKKPSLGGHMSQLFKLFPTLDDALSLLTPKLTAVAEHPNIEAMTSSEVIDVEGDAGNFKVRVKSNSSQRELEVQAIIVATGYEEFDPKLKPEYGYGLYENVITSLELERRFSKGEIISTGPPENATAFSGVKRKGRKLESIVFIQCVGSRDKTVGNEYCSRVCCMNSVKQALLLKQEFPDARITITYIDIRAFGKGYEEFYEKAQQEGIVYKRGRPASLYQEGNKLMVKGVDTLLGETSLEEADLVILATGMVPAKESASLRELLGISKSPDGFFLEAHPQDSVYTEREGIFLAGCCQGPKDITDTVAQASAAAMASIILLRGK